VGYAVVYGVSNNTQSWWQGDDAERIGYRPRDSADAYREELARLRPDEPPPVWQGGNIFMRDYRKPETLVNYKPGESPLQANPDTGHDC
jgi:uronate dehydrogenase